MTNNELAKQFQILSEIYENNPDIPQPSSFKDGCHEFLFCTTKESVEKTLKAFGSGEKYDGTTNILFYPKKCQSIIIAIEKGQICKKVKVGTREVPETITPGVPERIVPAHTEDVFEWECGSLLKPAEEEEEKEDDANDEEGVH